MLIDGTDPFAAAKPDARLIKLLLRARRFSATLAESDNVPFAAPTARRRKPIQTVTSSAVLSLAAVAADRAPPASAERFARIKPPRPERDPGRLPVQGSVS